MGITAAPYKHVGDGQIGTGPVSANSSHTVDPRLLTRCVEDAEQAVFSAILLDGGLAIVSPTLAPGDFAAPRHSLIMAAMKSLAQRQQVIDIFTLAEELERLGDLASIGGKDYLGSLLDVVPTAANVTYHARIVRDHSMRRALAGTLDDGSRLLRSGQIGPAEIAKKLRSALEVAAASTEPAPVKVHARPLRSWLADPEALRPPCAVIPLLVVAGRVTLLSGREKIGKSTLVAGAVGAASRGDAVLGVPLEKPVRTLWYALDEHVNDALRRFESLGADLDQVIINDSPRNERELLSALETDLAMFSGLNCVVVDTLSRVFAASGVDPNSSREVEPVITRLVDFFHRQNVAAILQYHTGKGGREYRGSTSIGATVDDVLTLRRRGEVDEDDFDDDGADDGRRLLVQDGRNLRGRLQLTWTGGAYQPYEDAVSARGKILSALRDHGRVASRGELVKLAKVRRGAGLRLISDLVAEDAIAETARGLAIASLGVAELSSRPESVPTRSQASEPTTRSPKFPGSHGFPEKGTGPEPQPEQGAIASQGVGSGSVTPPIAETGTSQQSSPVQPRIHLVM